MIYEFWESDTIKIARGINGTPYERHHISTEPNAVLLYRKEFNTYEEFKVFYDDFYSRGLRDSLDLLLIPSKDIFLQEYPCGLKVGDFLVLKSGFKQTVEWCEADFMRRVGWEFKVLSGEKEFPDVIWLETLKEGSQQKHFAILGDNIKRFELMDRVKE
jgi:hypothetical protein